MVCRNGSNQVAGLLLSLWCNKGSFARLLYLPPCFSVLSSLCGVFMICFSMCIQNVYTCLNGVNSILMITKCIFFFHLFSAGNPLFCTARTACMHLHTVSCSIRRITMSLACIVYAFFCIVYIENVFSLQRESAC